MSPIQFLRRYRMNGAHRELRAADPDATTVTRIASGWGFREVGRFAGDYRRMFGEQPSETLCGGGRLEPPPVIVPEVERPGA